MWIDPKKVRKTRGEGSTQRHGGSRFIYNGKVFLTIQKSKESKKNIGVELVNFQKKWLKQMGVGGHIPTPEQVEKQ